MFSAFDFQEVNLLILFDKNNHRKKTEDLAIYAVLFLCVFGILHHIPLSVDDRGFQNTSFATFKDALDYLIRFGNGRFLGNGGIIFLMHHLLIGDIVRAAVIAGVAVLLPKVLRLNSTEYSLLTLFLLLSISPGIFGQTYSWMSGFQNYVPPVFLFLVSIILVQYENDREKSFVIVRYATILFIGIIMQFYIEHSSCLNLLAAIAMTIWSFRKQKQAFIGSLMLLIGTFIGLFLMFFATIFLAPMVHGGVDSYFSGGIASLIRGVLRNAVILFGMYTENAVAIVMLSSVLLVVVYNAKLQIGRQMKVSIFLGLVIPSLFFLFNLFWGLSPWYGKLTLFESALLLLMFLWYTLTSVFAFYKLGKETESKEVKAAGFMFLAALICIFPVLFVWPVGYRCLFHSSVMLIGSLLLLIKELELKMPHLFCNNKAAIVVVVLLSTIVISLSAVFSGIRQMVSIRGEYLKKMAESGAEKVAYFTIPSPYIHELWNEDTEHFAIVNGRSIQLEIMPADVWFRTFYYQYS